MVSDSVQTRTPMTADDLLRFAAITEVSISPAGDRLVYGVSRLDREKESEIITLWLSATNGGEARQLETPGRSARGVRWTPDGKSILFSADNPTAEIAAANVHKLSINNGSRPDQLTSFPTGVAGFACHGPTGRLVVAVPDVPTLNTDPGVLTYEFLRYKDHLGGWLTDSRVHLWLLEAGRPPRRLTEGPADCTQPAFHPSGDSIAYVSNPKGDLFNLADVFLLDLSPGAKPRNLTNSEGVKSLPSFSPDGSRLAFYWNGQGESGSGRNLHVWIQPLDSNDAKDVLEGWDRPAVDILLTETRLPVAHQPVHWHSDGGSVLFVGTDRASASLYRVSAAGGLPTPLIRGEHEIYAYAASPDHTQIAAAITAFSDPGDVFSLGPSGLKRLSHINRDVVSERYLARPERLTLTGGDGDPIDTFVALPPDYEPKGSEQYPLILRIPAGPGLAYGNSFVPDIHVLAGAGFVVAQCNPRGSQSYGQEFSQAINGEWGDKDSRDLMAVLDQLLLTYRVDPTRLGVTGASYGGLLVNWLITQTSRFAAAVSQRSISNYLTWFGASPPYAVHALRPAFGGVSPYEDPHKYLERSPIRHISNAKTATLILQCAQDHVIPMEQAEQLYFALQYLGVPSRMVIFRDEGHHIRRIGRPQQRVRYLAEIADWFKRYLKGEH